MKIFMAGMDSLTRNGSIYTNLSHKKIKGYFGLYSYYYIKNKQGISLFLNSEKFFKDVLMDSGAHTFHTQKNINWIEYTRQYAQFIKKHDKENIIGYFEMDIDNRIGYKETLKLRSILQNVSDKIIPVWHKNRGINNFKKMCSEYDYVSISILPIEGINRDELINYVNYAHSQGCKIHGLGGPYPEVIDNVPFDSVDSIYWKYGQFYARYNGKKVNSKYFKENYQLVELAQYLNYLKTVRKYYKKWTGEELI